MLTTPPILTRHAQTRAQQRGICNEQIALALSYGVRHRVYCGRESFTLTDRALARGQAHGESSRSRGVRVIVQDDVIITVFHVDRVARRPGIGRRAYLLEELRRSEDRQLLRGYDC